MSRRRLSVRDVAGQFDIHNSAGRHHKADHVMVAFETVGECDCECAADDR